MTDCRQGAYNNDCNAAGVAGDHVGTLDATVLLTCCCHCYNGCNAAGRAIPAIGGVAAVTMPAAMCVAVTSAAMQLAGLALATTQGHLMLPLLSLFLLL